MQKISGKWFVSQKWNEYMQIILQTSYMLKAEDWKKVKTLTGRYSENTLESLGVQWRIDGYGWVRGGGGCESPGFTFSSGGIFLMKQGFIYSAWCFVRWNWEIEEWSFTFSEVHSTILLENSVPNILITLRMFLTIVTIVTDFYNCRKNLSKSKLRIP